MNEEYIYIFGCFFVIISVIMLLPYFLNYDSIFLILSFISLIIGVLIMLSGYYLTKKNYNSLISPSSSSSL